QDQYAAAVGGLNVIEFHTNGEVTVERLHIEEEVYNTLQSNLVMFYTGDQRSASAILSEQNKKTTEEDTFKALKEMVGLVYELKDALYKSRLSDFGKLLHENWMLKKKLASGISNTLIDEAYDAAMKSGALGGKLLGAG